MHVNQSRVKLLQLFTVVATILSTNNKSSVQSLRNGLALTPPMGWLAWARFTCQTNCEENPDDCINSGLFKIMANRLKRDNYQLFGYKYVNIDDCWSSEQRDNNHELVPDLKRFNGTAGMIELANFMHNEGLLLGIYGDCGTKTCAGYPAQLKNEHNLDDNYFDTDAHSFSNWHIDSLKIDGCNLDPSKAESICPSMARAIQARNRSILITCEWPSYMLKSNQSIEVNWSLAQESCNLMRYFEDVEDSWLSILSIIDYTVGMQKVIEKFHGPGSWFDPDQLVIGNFGLSLEQARAQMAIWCIWAAPLFMSNDLRNIKREMQDVLKNKKLIEVNQDKLGVFGLMVAENGDAIDRTRAQAFVKPIEPIKNGCPSFAIVYLNRQTLGNGDIVSFNLRTLFSNSAIETASNRYNELYPNNKPGGEFYGSQCLDRIKRAMIRDSSQLESVQQTNNRHNYENESIYYEVFDLIDDLVYEGKIGLNSNLTLLVKPSAVRVVKLIESK